MKSKALLVAALPIPFEGPWVPLTDAEAWRVIGEGDYGEGNVVLDVIVDESLPGSLLETDACFWPHVIEKASRARIVILKAFNGVPHVSVCIEEIGVSS